MSFGGATPPAPPPPPPPPPNPGTAASAYGANLQSAQRAAAAGEGSGFDNTVTNSGGQAGFTENTGGKKTLTGQ